MQQMSLFLPGFDPNEVLSLDNCDTDDFFGSDEPEVTEVQTKSLSEVSDGLLVSLTPLPSITPDLEVDSEADRHNQFSKTDEVEEPSSTQAPIAYASVLTRLDTVQRDAPPWPLLNDEDIQVQGDKAKFNANVSAIQVLRALSTEQRAATQDERLVMQKYTGWGGLKGALSGDPGWTAQRDILRDLLTEDESKKVRDSVLNAHYTEIPVVKAVWQIVQQLGFTGGRILDPSAGNGHFFGAMPQELAMCSDLHAVEIDAVSAQMHQALYGSACRTLNRGFEATNYPQGWFDLCITNVPFGNYPVACKGRKPYSRWSIHNYFLAKALEVVRPGGLVAIVTSTYTLDSSDIKRRAWIKQKAELVGALRLPTGAFERIASTDVSVDILVFRRRAIGEMPSATERPFVELGTLDQANVQGNAAALHREKNKYWIEHPECVLGRWESAYGQHGHSVKVAPSGDLETQMQEAIKTLPSAVYLPSDQQPLADLTACELGAEADMNKQGSLVLRDGAIYRYEHGRLVEREISGTRAERVRGLIKIRDITRELLQAQMDPEASDASLVKMRKQLNWAYDAFVSKYGWIFSRGNSLVFREDPDWPLLLALEHYDDENDAATKAAIFTERTTRPVTVPVTADGPEEAACLSMAEFGHINPGYVSQLLGMSQEEAMKSLCELSLAFMDPQSGLYQSRDEYLSGNVRKKLRLAKDSGEQFTRNVEALESVIPEDVPPGDIEVRLGVNWVLASEYLDFIGHLAGPEAMRYAGRMEVVYEELTGTWAVRSPIQDPSFQQRWGTKESKAFDVIVTTMNGRSITVKDEYLDDYGNTRFVVDVVATAAAREKQACLSDEFSKWLWADDARAATLVRRYNDEHNSMVDRRYDGSRLRLPGYSWYLAPSPHQLNAIARIMSGCNVLLAHSVGAGKTLEMVGGAMELRRLGLRKKIVHAVPNHMLEQFSSEFLRAYPGARLLIARKEDLHKERRKEFVARVALGDWDSIVMTHSTFERIPADPALVGCLIAEMLAEVTASLVEAKKDRGNRAQIKQLVKMEKLWKAKLESMKADWKKDDFISLRDLGVDQVMVDEAHLFKNLVRITQMDQISGLPNVDSQRAFDLFVKTRMMNAIHGDRERGVCLATGTPVANSMAELHVMQRLLQPNTLREQHMDSFDSWAAQYGRVVTALEVSPDGSTFRMSERFAQFVNLPELMSTFRQVADIQTKEMLNLPTPPLVGGSAQTIVCTPSDQLKGYIATLVKRAEAIRNREVKPEEDNMLSVTGDGRMAALDLRLVERSAPFDPNGKIGSCIAKTFELWRESESFRGAQMIFCDLGTPTGDGFNVYQAIKDGLLGLGVPEDEVAFIHDAKTDKAKATLFRHVREGRVRVLIASTQKGGVGTNVQTRLFALHELDVPWRPCDVEQRGGRIERRGNMCKAVHVIRYVTEGSFDAYSWQTLSAKINFISQVMSGNRGIRKVQDVSMTALSYEEIKAIACGNPSVKEKAQLDAELRKLEMLKSHHASSVSNARYEIADLQRNLKVRREQLVCLEADQKVIEATGENLVLDGVTFDGFSEAAAEALTVTLARLRAANVYASDQYKIGSFAGLSLVCVGEISRHKDEPNIGFRLGSEYVQIVPTYVHGLTMYKKMSDLIAERRRDKSLLQQKIESAERGIPVLQIQVASSFDKSARMSEIRERLTVLEVELGLHKNEAGTEALDESGSVANKSGISGQVEEQEMETSEC